jgi:hypothetical protein
VDQPSREVVGASDAARGHAGLEILVATRRVEGLIDVLVGREGRNAPTERAREGPWVAQELLRHGELAALGGVRAAGAVLGLDFFIEILHLGRGDLLRHRVPGTEPKAAVEAAHTGAVAARDGLAIEVEGAGDQPEGKEALEPQLGDPTLLVGKPGDGPVEVSCSEGAERWRHVTASHRRMPSAPWSAT